MPVNKNQSSRSELISAFTLLASGSLIAQAVTVLSSPILTRLYTPKEFGLYALFVALAGSLSPAVAGKYEAALVLPSKKHQVYSLAYSAFALSIVCFITVLGVLLYFAFTENSVPYVGNLGKYLYFIPLYLLLIGWSETLFGLCNKFEKYKLMSISRLIQAVTIAIVSISFGVFGFGIFGLICGVLSGSIVSSIAILCYGKLNLISNIQKFQELKTVAKAYKNFPIYNATSSIFDAATVHMPIFFLSMYYEQRLVGLYALTVRVFYTPLIFISSTLNQILLKKISELVNADIIATRFLVKSMALLSIVVFPVFIVLYFFGENLFGFVFGSEWAEAGKIAKVLAAALSIRFVISSVSVSLNATNNNEIAFYWKILSFISTLILFFIFANKMDFYDFLFLFVIVDIAIYLLYAFLILYSTNRPKKITI